MIKELDLEQTILDIESTPPLQIKRRSNIERFKLWNDPALKANLSGGDGTFFIRSILNQLGINEHHLFKWRIENKYNQYQILNHYIPGCMAETISLSEIFNQDNGPQKVREYCDDGFFLKKTLGDGSGRKETFDKTGDIEKIINDIQKEDNYSDNWILQRKLNLKSEFRIHSFNRDIIEGLTFNTLNLNLSDRSDAEGFLKDILNKLPDSIVQSALIGWDIARTKTNRFYVIEGNFTGFHPDYSRGFQTSGFLGEPNFGAIMCAVFNDYILTHYQLSLGTIENSLLAQSPFLTELLFYSSIIKEGKTEFSVSKSRNAGENNFKFMSPDITDLFIKLFNYFRYQQLPNIYYSIK